MRRRGLAVAAVGTAVLVACSSPDNVAKVKKDLDQLPLPAGTTIVSEQTTSGGGDTSAAVKRSYHCASDDACGTAFAQSLKAAGWQAVDPTTLKPDAALFGSVTDAGGLTVLPPGKTGTGITLTWSASGVITAAEEYGDVR